MKLPTEWPVEVKNGSVRARIYRVENVKGEETYVEFRLVFYDPNNGNKRRFESFCDYPAAKQRANEVVARIAAGDAKTLALTANDRLIYLRAVEAMKALPGVPLDSAVQELVKAKQALGQHSLEAAVNFFLKNMAGLQTRTATEVVGELLQLREQRTKKGHPASAKYLADLRNRLSKFASDFQCPIGSVTAINIGEWLDGLKLKGRTRFNYARVLKTLFKFAQGRKYYPRDIDPMEGIETQFVDDGAIEIFSPEELTTLLASARPELVPFLVIGAFAGLRSAEIQRLDWADLKASFIEVTAGKAKTRSRRLVPIQPNLAKWLANYRQDSGPVVPFANVAKQIVWLVESTHEEKTDGTAKNPGVVWKHNALRHSFISYRMAQVRNEHTVSTEAGNSPAMIFHHYRELTTPEVAERWFAIEPQAPANVVTLPAAAVA